MLISYYSIDNDAEQRHVNGHEVYCANLFKRNFKNQNNKIVLSENR